MADLLRLRPLAADDMECVDTIHASGQALARQINDILDLSKIEAGELSLESIEFDLHALINTTLRIFQPQVAAKQLQLQENLDPRTPYLLHGDPHKLRQVIINLVGNALKFTEQGYVSVRVYPREFTDDGVLLRFEIADTGIGIPLERQAAIFEPFTQADDSVTRSYGGTGLGTTICKNIVELMDGEIGIQSTPGKGTTFWFELPFSVEDRQSGGASLSWAGDCKVLFVESGTGDDIRSQLDAWGITCDSATTLEHASKLLACRTPSEPYDALLIGHAHYSNELVSLLTDIMENTQLKHTSAILVTDDALISAEDVCNHDRLYVLNPESDKNILLNTLHASYSRHSTEEDIVHIAHHQVRAQTGSRTLEILVADDNATNRMVVQRMLEKLGHQCTVVDGGTAALEQLEEAHYDAVIIDKNMPDLGGVETYQAYSLAHGGNPPVEFIALTADATAESREACRSAGIELFMTKPVSLVKLQETLAAVRATGQALTPESTADREPAKPPNAQDAAALPVINETEFEGLVRLAGGDPAFITDLIRNFETDAGNDIRGLEAAVASQDLLQFRDFAHALKGGALYLGLSELARLSLEAEQTEADAFRCTGVACVQAMQRAADAAIRALHDRESALQAIG
jgi:two-component system sensor histidine kinase RpfC